MDSVLRNIKSATLPFFPQEKGKGWDGFGNLINGFIQHIVGTP